MAFTPEGLLAINDGAEPLLHRLDPLSGALLGTIVIDARFIDKESVTCDDQHLYIGDFGNNKDERTDLRIARVPLAALRQDTVPASAIEWIRFRYPEQTDFAPKKDDGEFDCEAMVALGDSLYLFTKRRRDHRTKLYALPKEPGDHAALPKGLFNARGRISGASLSADGSTLVLVGYQNRHQFPFLYRFTGYHGAEFFAGQATYFQLSYEPLNWQIEAIALRGNDEALFCNERTPDREQAIFQLSFGPSATHRQAAGTAAGN